MSLHFFIYRSWLRHGFETQTELRTIEAEALRRNVEYSVTGFMHVEGVEVLQYLEGEQSGLDFVKSKIIQDPRHHRMTIFDEGELRARRFPNWDMGISSPEIIKPLKIPPAGVSTEDYIVFLEVAALRSQKTGMGR